MTMKIKLAISFIIITVIILTISFLIYTDRVMVRAPVMVQKSPKITFIIGNAWHRAPGSDKWEVAIVGQVLTYGYDVKTGVNSQLDIRFHNSMAIRVSQNSILRLEDLSVRKAHIKLLQGSLFGRFEKLFKDYDIRIQTPTTIAAVRGTELGFEISKEIENDTDEKKSKTKQGSDIIDDASADEPEAIFATMVYSLSGITELVNPKFPDEMVLLSYQKKLLVKEMEHPANPEAMTDTEIMRMRTILNSIHTEEVLFISDKINFEVGSAKILPESDDELEKIYLIMNEKKVKVRIEGHTDSQGTASFNQNLSVDRAKSIRKYFIEKGIKPDYLTIAGYGASKPIADNDTKEGRALNRRVEFIIME